MGALLDAVPAGGADHTEHHRDLATAVEAVSPLTPGVDYPTSATVTLTSADILALNSTPVEVVAAPGAGKRIAVHLVTGAIDYGTTPYTVPDHVYVNVGFVGIIQLDALFTATESAGYEVAPTGLLVPMSAAENGSVTISASDSNPTDGDSPAPITVWYTVQDV